MLLFICWLRAVQTLPEGEKALGFENRPRALPHATVVLSNAHSIYNLAVWCKNAGTEPLHDFTVDGVRVTPANVYLEGLVVQPGPDNVRRIVGGHSCKGRKHRRDTIRKYARRQAQEAETAPGEKVRQLL